MTILADRKAAAAAKAAPAKPDSILVRQRAQTHRGELVEMPMFGSVWVELTGERALDEIDGATVAILKAEGLDAIPLNGRAIERCRDALTLAWAVRNPDDHAERVGSSEEWRDLDADLIVACALVYNDVRERLSPIAMHALTEEQFRDIRLQIEKKNAVRLREHGVVALSLYLLSTADPPANSPTTKSSSSGSS